MVKDQPFTVSIKGVKHNVSEDMAWMNESGNELIEDAKTDTCVFNYVKQEQCLCTSVCNLGFGLMSQGA